MSNLAHKQDGPYTWADYRTWPDTERWELIGGQAWAMSPSPTSRHQQIAFALIGEFYATFRKHKCRAFAAPMDVRLSDEDVVQPDLLVVCNPLQIQRTHIEGPPKLAVEILSPDSLVRDRQLKMGLYARAGIQEYWIVTPFPSLIEIYELDAGRFRHCKSYSKDETLASPTFPELAFELSRVFDFPLEPEELEIMRVKEPPAKYHTPS